MYMNLFKRYFTVHQLFLFIFLINHATSVIQASPIDATEAVSDNEEVTTTALPAGVDATLVTLAASPTTSSELEADHTEPTDEESRGLTLSKREEPLSVKNDSNESSREDEEETATSSQDSTSELTKDEVTDQLASESEGELRKQGETHEEASEGESKNGEAPATEEDAGQNETAPKKEEEASIEKETTNESEREKFEGEKSILQKMWVKQGAGGGGVFAYPSKTFTFKSSSPVHSSILILPLVSPAYQMVTGDVNDSPSHRDDATSRPSSSVNYASNFHLVKANAFPHHIFQSSPSQSTPQSTHPLSPLSPSQVTAHHGIHNTMKDLFMNQLASSAVVQPFDSTMRFTSAHSNSPMIPLLQFDSSGERGAAASLFSHHPHGLLSGMHPSSQGNYQFGSFAPVNLPTRWWHSYPSHGSPSTAPGHSGRRDEETPAATVDSDDVTVLAPANREADEETASSTESTAGPASESTGESVNEEVKVDSVEGGGESEAKKEEAAVAVEEGEKMGDVKEEKTDDAKVNGESGDTDGDSSESGGERAKRQAVERESGKSGRVDAATSGSTIDDVVKSIVAENSKNNALRGKEGSGEEEESASAPSTPREDALKNGQGKKALGLGLEIASGILSTIRAATSDGVEAGESLISSSTRHNEMSLSSLLGDAPLFNHHRRDSNSRVKWHDKSAQDSGLFHVFRGVFGDN